METNTKTTINLYKICLFVFIVIPLCHFFATFKVVVMFVQVKKSINQTYLG